MLQNIGKIEGDPLKTLKNFAKSHEDEKKGSAEKCKKGDPLGVSTSIQLQNIKKLKGTLRRQKKSKMSLPERAGKSYSAEKLGRGNPSALEWFCIPCSRLWMR